MFASIVSYGLAVGAVYALIGITYNVMFSASRVFSFTAGMLGMLVATGLAISHWAALPGALIIFFIGTTIRVRSEEKLLREAFGEQFETYVRNVRAIIPGLF